MANIIRKTTDLAMLLASQYAFEGSIIIDATCGNGHDTLTLAKTKPSKLYGFDIQQDAVDATKALLSNEGFESQIENGTISIICDSHSNMHQYISDHVNVIMFNLGYLPGGDKSIVTQLSETSAAIHAALELLSVDGVLCITMYSGHEEGKKEKEMLLELGEDLDSRIYHTAYINFLNQQNNPPEILLITRKK